MRILYGLKGHLQIGMTITRNMQGNPSEISNLDEILSESLTVPVTEPQKSSKSKSIAGIPPLPCKKPGEKVDQELAFRWLADLNEDQAKQILIYVYRLQPVINKEPKYIEKYEGEETTSFSFNYLKTAHGGGMYEVSVNELGSGTRLFRFQIAIDSSIYPAIISIKEIDTNSAKNERFIADKIRKGEWKYENGNLIEVEKGKEQMTTQPPVDHVAIIDSAFKSVRETMSMMKPEKVAPSNDLGMIITMMNNQMESQRQNSDNMMKQMQANSDNQMKMFLAMMDKSNKPVEVPKADDTLIKFMMEEVKATKEQTTKLIETMVAQKPTIDPMKQILQTMEVMRELKSGLGGDNEEREKDWKEKLGDMALENAPTLLAMISGGLGAQRAGLPPEIGIANVSASANGPVGYNASNPVPQPRPMPSQPIATPQSEIDQLLANPTTMLIISQKINEGVRGWEFGGMLTDMFGRPSYNQIANVGIDELFAAIKRNVNLRNAISTFSDEKLKIWVTEFVNMDTELEKQDVIEEKELVN